MKINQNIQGLAPGNPSNINKNNNKQLSFSNVLKDQLNKVNDMQIKADESTEQLITGETQDIHGVMLATEEARLALEMAVQVRNKVMDAYQEISRMQL